MKYQISLSRKFILYSLIIVFLAFSYLLHLYIKESRARNNQDILDLSTEISFAGKIFDDSAKYTSLILSNILNDISQNPENKNHINKVLKSFRILHEGKLKDVLSISMFSWVDKKNILAVNSEVGILKNKMNLSDRDYLQFTKSNPNKLYFGKSVIGAVSNQYIIPAGIGFIDNKGDYKGSVIMGFDIDGIYQKFLKGKVLAGSNLQIIYKNEFNIIKNAPNIDKEYLSKINLENPDIQILKKPSIFSSAPILIYQKIANTPYGFLVSYSNLNQSNFTTKSYIPEFIFIISFFVILIYLLKKDFINPIIELSKEAQMVRLGKDIVIPKSNVLEINQLSKSIISIKDFIQSERVLKSQLDKANRHLQALNKSINHDLRNYISGILGVAQIIADESVVETQHFASPNAKETQDVAKETQDVAKETQDVASLQQINQNSKLIIDQAKIMLKFSNSLITDEGIERKLKLQMANRKLGEETEEDDFEDIDIDALINQLILLKRPFTKEQEVSVKIDITESLPILRTNLIEIRKILDNLITNAIKYSPKGSEVVIKAAIVENQIEIEIIDNGIGMSPEDIEKALSGEGKSIDKSGIDKPIDSHGIGFPIVKKAVENLDAVMEIKSEKGKGTKIAVRFKIGKKQIAADRGGELHSPLQPTQSTSTTPSSSSSINSSLNGKTILIADDEALILMATERQLMRLGCNVLTAKSGDEVITILDNNHCDVVLMDCNMTKVNDGLATTKLIREGSIFKNFKNYQTIPIIAFSANTDQKSQDAALKSGMNGYLEKPFDKEMFAKIVNGFQD